MSCVSDNPAFKSVIIALALIFFGVDTILPLAGYHQPVHEYGDSGPVCFGPVNDHDKSHNFNCAGHGDAAPATKGGKPETLIFLFESVKEADYQTCSRAAHRMPESDSGTV